MKKLFLFLFGVSVYVTAGAFNVVIRHSHGDKVMPTEEISKIVYDGIGGVTVHFSDNTSENFDAASFRQIRFDSDVDGIGSVESEANLSFRVVDGYIVITGENIVNLYNHAGVHLATGTDGKVCIKDLTSGIYIVESAGHSAKIILK